MFSSASISSSFLACVFFSTSSGLFPPFKLSKFLSFFLNSISK